MALDRAGHDQDSVRADKAGRRESGADAATDRGEPAEMRSRAEYYAARTADDLAVPADEGRSGWDAVDTENTPPLDAIRITSERRTHILDGDAFGGGHRHGTGRPGKTEFPATWDDEKIIDTLLDVARLPDRVPQRQDRNGHWVTRGTRDDVDVVAIVAGDGRVWSGWPLPGGPGVVKNPKET